MKFLKYLLLLILALVVIGLLYVSMQPSDYNVSRSKVINRPVSDVFNTINDLKTWEKWGPWHDEDSTIVITYGDKTVGVGASDSWTSKDGPGSMTTVALEPNSSILQEMRFGDSEPSETLWNFEETSEGTKVTWTMKDDKAPFMFKIFSAMSGGWDAMLGPMLAKGLDNLEAYIETIPVKYTLSKIEEKQTEDQYFIGYRHAMKIDQEAIMKTFNDDMPKVIEHLVASGISYDSFTTGALYFNWDEENGETEMVIGAAINKEVPTKDSMELLKIPASKVVTLSKCGGYGDGDYEAHTAINTYLSKNNLEINLPIYELYVNDPSKVKPLEVQTDIYYPVK